MKASKKEMLISVLLCLLPIVLGLVIWKDLPDKIPTHFDLNNNPNGYSGKGFAVFGLPCFMAVLDALCLFGLSSDPKADRHSKVLDRIMLWFIPALSCVLVPVCLFMALGKSFNISLFCQLLIGVLFIVIGNYLPKCRQNYTMGIKLPWTLNDENNWNYTHRLGGFVWVAAGLLQLLNAVLGKPWMLFVCVFAAMVIPTAASYFYYRRHRGE